VSSDAVGRDDVGTEGVGSSDGVRSDGVGSLLACVPRELVIWIIISALHITFNYFGCS
jgi:hypothetical protein